MTYNGRCLVTRATMATQWLLREKCQRLCSADDHPRRLVQLASEALLPKPQRSLLVLWLYGSS